MNWDYLAGFIDGEGTITFGRAKQRKNRRTVLLPMLIIYQKDLTPLVAIRDFLRLGMTRGAVNNAHRFEIRGAKLLPILTELSPRLLVKRRQADALIEFITCRSTKRNLTYDEHCLGLDAQMREWNRRGAAGMYNSWEGLTEEEMLERLLARRNAKLKRLIDE
jgi:hypothetical protein